MVVYKIDPEIAKCLPPLDGDRFQWLKKEIKTNGYNDAFPIIIWKDHNIIVDGHHRYKICRELGIEPLVSEQKFESLDDAILFAIDHQENRRNLNETQRALLVVKRRLIQERIESRKRSLANLFPSGPNGATSIMGRTSTNIAREAKVGEHTVRRVITVVDKGDPDIQKMMMAGKLSARAGEDFVRKFPPNKQKDIIKGGGVEAVKKHVTDARNSERIDSTERKDRAKFEELTAKVSQRMTQDSADITNQFKGAKSACFLPNVSELWCNQCKWGFDVYLPTPAEPSCPYCGESNLSERDKSWYPQKKTIR